MSYKIACDLCGKEINSWSMEEGWVEYMEGPQPRFSEHYHFCCVAHLTEWLRSKKFNEQIKSQGTDPVKEAKPTKVCSCSCKYNPCPMLKIWDSR